MRVHQRKLTLPPDFWSAELRYYFDLWLKDMSQGMRPYTPRTVQTFEWRFILYTRKGWEGKTTSLTLQEVFQIPKVYEVLSLYPIQSYSNRHNMLYSLVSFAKFLITLGVLDESVLTQLRRLRPKRVYPARKTVLRETSEVDALRRAITQKRYDSEYSRIVDLTVIETFIQTGLRISELCQLNLEDVDFKRGIIAVHLGKGRKSRKVGISQGLEAQLRCYLNERTERLILNPEALFINRRGTRIKGPDITRRLLRLSRLAGVEVTAHGLRRTFATLNANNGKPLHLIQLALGHSDIRTTQEYLMTDESQVVEAMRHW